MTDYPPFRDPADYDREFLLDVAAAATRDSWPLVGRRDLVEAICADYGKAITEAQGERERHESTQRLLAAERKARAATERRLVELRELQAREPR